MKILEERNNYLVKWKNLSIFYAKVETLYEAYYYKKNLQEDIIEILDSSFNEVLKYIYRIWRKVIW